MKYKFRATVPLTAFYECELEIEANSENEAKDLLENKTYEELDEIATNWKQNTDNAKPDGDFEIQECVDKQEEFKFYQTDFKGNILNEFWTISEAEKELKIRGTAISKILKNGNYCKLGYFLSYDISKLPLKVPKNYAGNKTIIQYDSNFNKINEFNSPKEIEALTDVSYKAVFSAIERKGKAGGFYWQYLNNNK